MKKTVWLAALFVAAVLGYIAVSSFRPKPFRCRVCMTFNAHRDCRIASADTQREAVQTAIVNACSELSGGVIEANQCQTTPPDSI